MGSVSSGISPVSAARLEPALRCNTAQPEPTSPFDVGLGVVYEDSLVGRVFGQADECERVSKDVGVGLAQTDIRRDHHDIEARLQTGPRVVVTPTVGHEGDRATSGLDLRDQFEHGVVVSHLTKQLGDQAGLWHRPPVGRLELCGQQLLEIGDGEFAGFEAVDWCAARGRARQPASQRARERVRVDAIARQPGVNGRSDGRGHDPAVVEDHAFEGLGIAADQLAVGSRRHGAAGPRRTATPTAWG
jgi:hypothetical protein